MPSCCSKAAFLRIKWISGLLRLFQNSGLPDTKSETACKSAGIYLIIKIRIQADLKAGYASVGLTG